MKKTLSRRGNKRAVVAAMLALVLGVGVLVVWGPVGPDNRAVAIGAGYAVLVSGFLVAQAWGFIVAQTEYNDTIEEPKFVMLEKEEQEWKS